MALLLAIPAVAADNYTSEQLFAHGFDGPLRIYSGEAHFQLPAETGSLAFYQTEGVTLAGLSRICWYQGALPTCVTGSPARPEGLSIALAAGGSFGLSLPTPSSWEVDADHAVGSFMNLGQASVEGGATRFGLGPAMVFSLVGGRVQHGDLPALVNGTVGYFVTLDNGTNAQVLDSFGQVVRTIQGSDGAVTLEGHPVLDLRTLRAQLVGLPFPPGATAVFSEARAAAARAGLSPSRIQALQALLGSTRFLQDKQKPASILGQATPVLAEVFNGAFVDVHAGQAVTKPSDVNLARFSSLAISGAGDNRTQVTAQIKFSTIGASSQSDPLFVRAGGLQLPWFCYDLVLAAGLAVLVRWGLRSPLQNPVWRRYEPFGRVAGAIAIVTLVVAWNLAFQSLLGTSVTATHSTGSAFFAVAGLEAATLLVALVVLFVPAFFLFRSLTRILGQGTFMGLSATVAAGVTGFLGILALPGFAAFFVSLVG